MAIHIGLRLIAKKNYKAITAAFWLAIVIHVFAWFYWCPVSRMSTPELPDWVNVTLVTGFEERVEPQPGPAAPQVKQTKVNPKPARQPGVNTETESITEAKEEVSEASSASTFVEADSKPFALENPKPVYPSSARRRGMQGVVLLEVDVSNEGRVMAISVMRSSGFRVLDVAALNSVKQWRFIPARRGDTEVASTVQVPIRFILNNS